MDGSIKAREIIIARSLINIEIVEEVVDTDQPGAKSFNFINYRSNHVVGFFAALGKILPKGGGNISLGRGDVNNNIGGNSGGTFA